jgi:hypothetical protein
VSVIPEKVENIFLQVARQERKAVPGVGEPIYIAQMSQSVVLGPPVNNLLAGWNVQGHTT